MHENDLLKRTPVQKNRWFRLTIAIIALMFTPSISVSAEPSGREVIEKVEQRMWGSTIMGDYEMTVVTPHWKRTLGLRMWMVRPEKTFIRILSPAKEAGIGSLRIGDEMWNYIPKVERVVKIPPSMMLQPWMGSDFSNDDLVKESSVINDYTHDISGREIINGINVFRIESIPKPESPVVWGKLVHWVEVDTFLPVKLAFYNERGELIKELIYSEIRELGGREIPTRWEMRAQSTPDNVTIITVKKLVFDQALDEGIFVLRNLRRMS
jgi:outer membrane lipoprotein-sorting protein